jgi:hypothetical protein
MDPYLEHPGLWPDFHNSLIAALREDLAPRVAPRYYIGLERRVFRLTPDDLVFIGRPDLSVVERRGGPGPQLEPAGGPAVLTVEVPLTDEVSEYYLEVRGVPDGQLVTVVKLRSPVNKLGSGRTEYLAKREHIFRTHTSLVEVDLLRAGEPMPIVGAGTRQDYSILVSRGSRRPKAQLYTFGLRQPIPSFPLPLAPGEPEPEVELNRVLHALYARVHLDLAIDNRQPPVPPLPDADAEWARGLLAG